MPGLYRDATEKRNLEIRNGAIQFLAAVHYADEWRQGESMLRPSLICELQRLAVNQIYSCAGRFRDGPVIIRGAKHSPPRHTEVPGLVEEMCEYTNRNWCTSTPVHLASYLMWRINWIHPFFGGNGRTARAVSYMVLCASIGFRLPGEITIPKLIVAERDCYMDALQSADAAYEDGVIDVSRMEDLVSRLLAKQLLAVYDLASGRPATPKASL